MSTYRLEQLFAPRSVALVGASPRAGSMGAAVFRNLVGAGFAGPLHLVNPKYAEIEGRVCAPSLSTLPSPPDVVVITTPRDAVFDIVEESGRLGVAAAIIVTAGVYRGPASTEERIAQSARRSGM